MISRHPPHSKFDLWLAGGVAGFSTLLLLPLLRLWRIDLAVPMAYGADSNLNAMAVKSALDGGWGLFNGSLGAPFGQRLHDFPFADNLSLATIKLVSLLLPGWGRSINVFFLLTFPLTALVAFLVLRRWGISRFSSATIAVLYTMLPLHFLRGEVHLFLSSYFMVPLACHLVLSLLSDQPLFSSRRARAATIATCVVVGSSLQYYALFTALLVLAAMGLRLLRRFDRRVLLRGAAVLVLVLGTFSLNLLPTVIERWRHGANPEVAERSLVESELYGVTIAQLVLPVEHHRLPPLANLRNRYSEATVVRSEGSAAALGLAGSIGLAYLMLGMVARMMGREWRGNPLESKLSAISLTALVLATAGGGSVLIGLVITPQLRAWNRMSVFIAFFALAALGFLLDRLSHWLRQRTGNTALVAAACGLVTILGVLDQTTDRFVPNYSANAIAFRNDAQFARAIESSLPNEAAIFQLPYTAFPEDGPLYGMFDYDHAIPFLHTSRVRWSYGAMRGRPSDWAAQLDGRPATELLPRLAAAGFIGVYVDRFGYADGAVALEAHLRSMLKVEPLISPDARRSFFDMRRYVTGLRRSRSHREVETLRRVTLYPVRVQWGVGFSFAERSQDDRWHWAVDRRSELRVVNPSSTTRHVILEAQLLPPLDRSVNVEISWGDGAVESVLVTGGTDVRHVYRLSPGGTDVSFLVSTPPGVAPDARAVYFRVVNVRANEP